MKVNSQIRNNKQNLIINVSSHSIKPDLYILNTKYKYIIDTIREILLNSNNNICYQQLYQNINDILLFEISDEFIKGIEELFISYSISTIDKFLKIMHLSNLDEFFQEFNRIWNNVLDNFSLLKKILTKFEKKYYNRNYKQNNLWSLYIDHIKENSDVKIKFISLIIERIIYRITECRDSYFLNNIMITLNDIIPSVNFLWESGFYKEEFNNLFLKMSIEYYKNLGYMIFDENSIQSYIDFIEKSLKFESGIIHEYLNDYTDKKMINLLEENLLIYKKNDILSKLFTEDIEKVSLLNNDNIKFISKIYLFFKKVKLDEDLKNMWLGYINKFSLKIYSLYFKPNQSVNFFENMLNLKKNMDSTVKDSFLTDDKFKVAAKEGFTKALNLKPNFAADILSRYIDHIFEESDKGEKYIMEKIDEFMVIFKYLDSKDMFETFYIKKLSSRLLYNLTNSKKGEFHLIERLKHECGTVFVTKAEEMIDDIDLSQEITLNSKYQSKINYNFYVLSSFSWPVQKIVTGYINDEINFLHNAFIEGNSSRFPGKVLSWHLPYCSSELIYNFNNKKIILEVNGLQAAILIKFNNKNLSKGLNIKFLTEHIGIMKDDILPTLNILVNKEQILSYSNNLYVLNQNYNPLKHYVILNNFNDNEETNVEEIREVEERNWEDRKHVIDALIMKVIKHKKQLKQDDVIHGVIDLVKFNCEISKINERLYALIDNGYLVRDEKEELIKYS